MNARTLRRGTIIGSVVLHGLLALAIFFYGSGKTRRGPTSVMLVEDEKKKNPGKKDERPKPPPPSKKIAVRSRDAVAPRLTPPPVNPEPTRMVKSPRPPQVAGSFSNDPTKGGGAGPGDGQGGGGQGPPPRVSPVKAPLAKAPEEDPCTEAPTKPQPILRPTEIEYTQQARADGVEGRLVLKIIVGDNGAVTDVVATSGVESSLDAAAIAAVKTWIFKPAQRCGKRMSGGVFMYAHRFELGD